MLAIICVFTPGLPGPVIDEHVGEARDHQAEVGERPAFPMLAQRRAVGRADVDLVQRAGHGVEAGGEDDGVELECSAPDVGAGPSR